MFVIIFNKENHTKPSLTFDVVALTAVDLTFIVGQM